MAVTKVGDTLRRVWDATEQLFDRDIRPILGKGPMAAPIEAHVTARRLDGRPLTLTVRQVQGIHRRLDLGLTTPATEAGLVDVRVEVIHAIREGKIFANLPKELRVLSPETLEGEGIEVHERWAGKTWKGKP